MRKMFLLLLVICFASVLLAEGQEFKWVRIKFKCKEADAQEEWDTDKKADETFLNTLERYSTLKVDKTWNVVTLDKLDEMIKYPLLFMTASGTPNLSELEIKNLKEYLDRGGFLLCDDSNWPARGGNIFAEGMKKIFEKAYPKSKIMPLEMDHELFTAHFDMPLGYYQKLWFGTEKSPFGVWTLADDKGRSMVFFTLLLQNTWSGFFRPEKQEDSIKFGVNLVMYALTH